eukprot:TRINITY_DN3840_c0_g3_i1.p4 TRINITY_DN3840_c0_g3~~TRINITY_DN3840_c0_g3_i1.p4  ORF type:complete len:194 (-),score=-13.40 TRINITY_DN3840_c0_g3_i1:17-598(-)
MFANGASPNICAKFQRIWSKFFRKKLIRSYHFLIQQIIVKFSTGTLVIQGTLYVRKYAHIPFSYLFNQLIKRSEKKQNRQYLTYFRNSLDRDSCLFFCCCMYRQSNCNYLFIVICCISFFMRFRSQIVMLFCIQMYGLVKSFTCLFERILFQCFMFFYGGTFEKYWKYESLRSNLSLYVHMYVRTYVCMCVCV